MKPEDKALARLGLKLAVLEKRPLIKGECISKFKTLCMAVELSELGDHYDCEENADDIEAVLGEDESLMTDAYFWAIQMLFAHFSQLSSDAKELI